MRKNKYFKYIPTYCAQTVFDIDYNKLYDLGKKIILTDLDNTLISYRINSATCELIKLNEKIRSIGFKIYIVSNNNGQRINEFSKTFKIDGCLVKASKPNPSKINAFIKKYGFDKNEVVFIGDQLVTDIAGANNANLDSILVSTIDVSSQKWYTKINRLREKKIIRNINKFDSMLAKRIEKTVNRGKHNE